MSKRLEFNKGSLLDQQTKDSTNLEELKLITAALLRIYDFNILNYLLLEEENE